MKKLYTALLLASSFTVATAQYCAPTFQNGCFSWSTQSITLGNLSWNLGSNDCATGDYTSMYAALSPGTTVSMTVTNGTWTGCAVWVDMDQSGSFEDFENVYYGYADLENPTYTFDVTIPAIVPTGTYRVRVISPWGSDGFLTTNTNGFGPCGAYQYGNFVDFNVNIGAPTGVAPSVADANGILASANPTDGRIVLNTGKNNVQRVQVRSMDGRVVRELAVTNASSTVELDLTAMPAGAYAVECIGADAVRSVRVVKQ